MFYLLKKGNELPKNENIYSSKIDKLKIVLKIWANQTHFKALLSKIYPEITSSDFNDFPLWTPGLSFNPALLGLHIQAVIAIIENPNIFYTESKDEQDNTELFIDFRFIDQIKHIDYNGNYCKLIGTGSNRSVIIKRVFLSETDNCFIPSHAEFTYNSKSRRHTWSSYLVYNVNSLVDYEFDIRTLFIEDYDLELFLNSPHHKPKQLYIYVNSLSCKKIIDFLKKEDYKFILLIRVKKINDLQELRSFLLCYQDTLSVCINSTTGDSVILKNLPSILYDLYNVYIDESLNISANSRLLLNFRDFGLINSPYEDFQAFRKSKQLPVICDDSLNAQCYEIL